VWLPTLVTAFEEFFAETASKFSTSDTVATIEAGNYCGIAVTALGRLLVFGKSEHQAHAHEPNVELSKPVCLQLVVPSLQNVKIEEAKLTFEHVLALGSTGPINAGGQQKVFSFGWNKFGQLGNGTTKPLPRPFQVHCIESLKGMEIKSIAVGATHSMVLCKNNGTLYVFGSNTFGQCGSGVQVGVIASPRLHTLSNVERIYSKGWHTVLMRYDEPDSFYVFGRNTYGQVANNDDLHVFSPLLVRIDAKLVQRVLVGMNCTFVFIRSTDETFTNNLYKSVVSQQLTDLVVVTNNAIVRVK